MLPDDSEDYGLSSESKKNRFSYTPNYNLASSDRKQDYDDNNKQNLNRIFSDLSAKVVNINNGSAGL